MKKKKLMVVGIIMALALTACGGGEDKLEWPDSGIASELPIPDTKDGDVGLDIDDTFHATLIGEDYKTYVESCKERGFTVEIEEDNSSYSAYREDGYKVELKYDDDDNEMDIHLYAPKINGTFTWPSTGLAALIPSPKTDVGTIKFDSSGQFLAYIGETSIDGYNAYIDECIASGFDVDYSRYEKAYQADDSVGNSLRIEYEGFNTMSISMYDPDDEDTEEEDSVTEASTTEATETSAEEPTPSEPTETSAAETSEASSGIRPEFKETMDSYEAFFNQYAEFMKNYAESDDTTSMLTEYAEYVTQYTDTMNKLNSLDMENLSDEELLYYTEVMTRINKKLAEVSIEIQ